MLYTGDLCCLVYLCGVQACDFLGDVAAVKALCKILGATLFPEPAADGSTVENNSITEVS